MGYAVIATLAAGTAERAGEDVVPALEDEDSFTWRVGVRLLGRP